MGELRSPCTRDCSPVKRGAGPLWVNDTHSALNRTAVTRILEPRSADEVAAAVEAAAARGEPLAIAGARHAMGGQQFLSGGALLDTRRLNHVRWFDRGEALLEVEAGITWPDVIRGYLALQRGPGPAYRHPPEADRRRPAHPGRRGRRQHPRPRPGRTAVRGRHRGAGGRHGRRVTSCAVSAKRTPTLFRHVVGGYGLFGVVTAVTLRLVPRVKVERRVARLEIEELIDAFDERIAAGHLYGDFQFATSPHSADFLRTGVLSSYRPVEIRAPHSRRPAPPVAKRLERAAAAGAHRQARGLPEIHRVLSGDARPALLERHAPAESLPRGISRRARSPARRGGARQRDDHRALRAARPRCVAFMNDVRRDFRMNGVDFIYGTIRLIEAEQDTALPWARRDWACVIFNLHIDHRREDMARAADHFRRLIDHALRHGGSYFLTYHRFASARPAARRASRHPRLPRRETRARSGRCVPERLVSRTCGSWSREAPHDTPRSRGGAADVDLRRAVRRACHRPARSAAGRARLAAGHGRLVLRAAALLPAAAGADRAAHDHGGGGLEPPRAQRRGSPCANPRTAGALRSLARLYFLAMACGSA